MPHSHGWVILCLLANSLFACKQPPERAADTSEVLSAALDLSALKINGQTPDTATIRYTQVESTLNQSQQTNATPAPQTDASSTVSPSTTFTIDLKLPENNPIQLNLKRNQSYIIELSFFSADDTSQAIASTMTCPENPPVSIEEDGQQVDIRLCYLTNNSEGA